MGYFKQANDLYIQAYNTKSPDSIHIRPESSYENIARFSLYFDKNPILAKKYIMQGLKEYPNDVTLWILLVQDESVLKNRSKMLLAVQRAYAISPNPNIKIFI